MGQALGPQEGPVKEERFLHPGNPFHWLKCPPGWKESFRDSEQSAVTSLPQAEQREIGTNGPDHLAAIPSQGHMSASGRNGLGAETWGPGDTPRERTGVGCAETA